MPNMASLHKQSGKPHWFCAFTTPDGKRRFKSTGTDNKSHARKISAGWAKAAELANQKDLTPDRARKLIDSTVSDVLESHFNGTMSRETLKKSLRMRRAWFRSPHLQRTLKWFGQRNGSSGCNIVR
jgi:hypothetical protein